MRRSSEQPHGDFSLSTVHTGPLLLTQNLEHLHQKSILSIALLVHPRHSMAGHEGKWTPFQNFWKLWSPVGIYQF